VGTRDAVFFDSLQKRDDVTGGSQLTTPASCPPGSAGLLGQRGRVCLWLAAGMSAEPGMWR